MQDRNYIDPSVFTQVWADAEQSIWAVNIKGSGKFGRSLDPQAIATQAATVARGIFVTRVFVIEKNETLEELELLRQVMRVQLKAGIKLHIITRAAFDAAKGDVVAELGSEDFVIKDGRTIYLSEPGGKKFTLFAATQTSYAQMLSLRIQRAAMRATSEDHIRELILIW